MDPRLESSEARVHRRTPSPTTVPASARRTARNAERALLRPLCDESELHPVEAAERQRQDDVHGSGRREPRSDRQRRREDAATRPHLAELGHHCRDRRRRIARGGRSVRESIARQLRPPTRSVYSPIRLTRPGAKKLRRGVVVFLLLRPAPRLERHAQTVDPLTLDGVHVEEQAVVAHLVAGLGGPPSSPNTKPATVW